MEKTVRNCVHIYKKKAQGNRSHSAQTNTHYVPRFKIKTAEAEARGSLMEVRLFRSHSTTDLIFI